MDNRPKGIAMSTSTTQTAPPGSIRCSLADREATASRLNDAVGAGRLTLEEAEQRLADVYRAEYRHELDVLVADLPAAERPASGWADVLARVRTQLAYDFAVVLGRANPPASTRRRLVTAAAFLGVVLAVCVLVMLVVNGFDGPGGFGGPDGPGGFGGPHGPGGFGGPPMDGPHIDGPH